MESNEIPKEAKRIGRCLKMPNIDKWWCPDCGATGTGEDIDFITENSDLEMVQYCCSECFEESLYATFNKNDE